MRRERPPSTTTPPRAAARMGRAPASAADPERRLKLLIVQRTIPPYRVPVFDRLGALDGLEVSVLHSGRATSTPGIHYREILVPRVQLASFGYQRGVGQHVAGHDVVIAPLDPHDLGTMARLYRSRSPVHVLWGLGLGRTAPLNALRLRMARRAAALLFYGEAARQEFIDRGCDSRATFVAPNTVHVLCPRFDPDAPRNQFLFVGSLKARKRVEDLLVAFARASERLPPGIGVTIVGSGSFRDRLMALAQTLGIGARTRFVDGTMKEGILEPLFRNALAYVSPGQVGLGVLHSFAFGVPVVTRRRAHHGPEFDNIRDGQNGLLYDGSIGELADLLVRLALDPDAAVALGREAHRYYLQQRTLDNMLDGFTRAVRFAAAPRDGAALPDVALQIG